MRLLLLTCLLVAASAAQAQRLTAHTSPTGSAGYGQSVAVDGTTMVVAAPSAPALYVYAWDGTTWTQQARLTTVDGGQLGMSVAISGSTIVAGNYQYSSQRGAAYVFVRNGTTWTQQARLTLPSGAIGDRFGTAVSIAGDLIVVGAPGGSANVGAAYVYGRANGVWTYRTMLTRPASTGLGQAVSISGTRIATTGSTSSGNVHLFSQAGGTWTHEQSLTVTNAADVSLDGDRLAVAGSFAYIYARTGTVWGQQAELRPNQMAGTRVALRGNRLVIGAPFERSQAGTTFVYGLEADAWTLRHTLASSPTGELAGHSVATDGERFVIGIGSINRRAYTLDPQLVVTPSPANFGTVSTGTVTTRDLTLSMTGSSATTISRWIARNTAFSVTPTPLTVGASGAAATLRFAPTVGGSASSYVVYEYGTPVRRDSFVATGSSVASRLLIGSSGGAAIALSGAYVGQTRTANVSLQASGLRLNVTRIVARDTSLKASLPGLPLAVNTTASGHTVTFTYGRAGAVDTYLYFEHDGSSQRDSIRVTGSGVASRLAYAPSSLAFGISSVGGAGKELPVSVSHVGHLPIDVTRIFARDPAFTVTTSLPVTVATGSPQALTVRFRPTEARAYSSRLIFERAGSGALDSLVVTGTGVVSTLGLPTGPVAIGGPTYLTQTAQHSLPVTATGASIQVSRVTARDTTFRVATAVPFNLAAGTQTSVTVRFTPASDRPHDTYLVFEHNGTSGRDSVRITGSVRPSTLGPSTSSLSFGNVGVGVTPGTATLSLTLNGTVPIQVTRVYARDSTFTVDKPMPFSVVAGTPQSVPVRFTPTRTVLYRSWLVIEHSAGKDSVALTGTGVGTRVAISPGSLTFAATVTGNPAPAQSVALSRSGPRAAVNVSRIYTSDPAFTVEAATPFTLTTTSRTVPVRFAPTAGRAYAARLYVEHDGTNGLDSITVMGEGRLQARLQLVGADTVKSNYVNALFRLSDLNGRGLDIPTAEVVRDPRLFTVTDNGDLQDPEEPESFYQILKLDQIPYRLRTVLMLDNSASTELVLPQIKAAARALVEKLGPNQTLAIYGFSEGAPVPYQPFTANRDSLLNAIDRITPGAPTTNLFGSVIEGLRLWKDLFRTRNLAGGIVDIQLDRGFLVLLSDGRDVEGRHTLQQVLAVRDSIATSRKRVYAVGFGRTINTTTLQTLAQTGQYVEATSADDIAARFVEVQNEILNDARSFYWLNYSSGRRGDRAWPLRVCVRGNQYTGVDACATATYSSLGFSSPTRAVYVDRTIQRLFGVESVDVAATGTTLTATTVLGLQTPSYAWTSSDPAQVTVTPVPGIFNQAVARRVGPENGPVTITVTDTPNGRSRSVAVRSNETCVTGTLAAGWNMVSVPMRAASMTPVAVYPGTTSHFAYASTGYASAAAFEPGTGYWLKAPAAATPRLCGTPLGTRTIALRQGWNMVGGFEAVTPVASLASTPSDVLASAFFGYDNGYAQATALTPGRGYWVKASSDGSVRVPAPSGSAHEGPDGAGLEAPLSLGLAPERSTDGVLLVVEDAAGRRTVLRLVASPDGRAVLPPLPPSELFDARFLESGEGSAEGNAAGATLALHGATYPVTVTASGLAAGQSIRLSDALGRPVSILRGSERVTIEAGERFSVSATGVDLPTEIALAPASPNPSRGTATQLRYALPEASRVRLSVYDVLGREVARLVEGEMPAGSHAAVLESGALPSGLYVVRMEAHGRTLTRTLVVNR